MASDKTYCRICEAACSLTVVRDSAGMPISLRPDKTHPISRGYACAKGTRFFDVATHPERLRFPQRRRSDGSLERLSWESAIELCGDRLRPLLDQHGPHAIGVYYGNPMLFNALGLVTLLNFNRVLGTRNVYSSFSQDCNNKFAAAELMHGGALIHPIPDLAQANLAIMLGSNPAVSQGSFVHLPGGATAFDRFVARGGHAVWVDPRASESARRWGEHVAIHPGTDIYLLLAWLDCLRDCVPSDHRVTGLETLLAVAAQYPADVAAELTGVPAPRIRALADQMRQTHATTFHMSVGVNQGPFGSLAYVAMQALAFLTGNLDKPGGLLFHPLGPALSRLLHALGIGTNPAPSRIGSLVGVFDELPGGILADEILTPGPGQIRALINVAGNPLRSIPGALRLSKALETLDFYVHIDLFPNASSATADLLLPATSWLERWDVATTTGVFQSGRLLQYAGPVLEPPGEVRSERRILADISLAVNRPLFRRARLARLWSRPGLDRGLTRLLDGLALPFRLWLRAQALPTPGPRPGRYLGRLPLTPQRRLRFWHADLNAEPDRLATHAAGLGVPAKGTGDGLFLRLISRRRRLGHNSWLHGGLRDGSEEARAWLNPVDLAAMAVASGDKLVIAGPEARLEIEVSARDDVLSGTIVVPHGLTGPNVNALIPSGPEYIEPVSGNHVMTGVTVRVVPAHDRPETRLTRSADPGPTRPGT